METIMNMILYIIYDLLSERDRAPDHHLGHGARSYREDKSSSSVRRSATRSTTSHGRLEAHRD